jgi:peptide/nickel transport system substrate-binding protein
MNMLAQKLRQGWGIFSLSVVVSLVLSACATPTPQVVVTQQITEKPVVVTATAGPTQTPVVVTATPEPTQPPAKTGPVTLVTSYAEGLDTPSPISSFTGWLTYLLLHDGLFDNNGADIVPSVAKSWTVSADNLVWTFKLAEGLTFSDGSAFNADEAAWALNLVRENKLGILYNTNYQDVTDIKALDPATLQVTLKQPLAEGVVKEMLTTWILPRSVWGKMSVDEILAYNGMDAAVGLGPYKLVSLKSGENEVLEARDGSVWGHPAIDRIVMQQYTSQDALVEALLAGEIDVADELPFTSIARLAGQTNVQLSVLDTTLVGMLIVNSSDKGTQPKSLMDPAVRHAIEYSIDKQQIADVAYLGYAEPLDALIPPTMGKWHNSDIKTTYDLEKAKQTLDQAGYTDRNGDGVREGPDGKPLHYRLLGISEPVRVRIQEIIAAGLKAIGISTESISQGWDGVLAAGANYDYDLMILSYNWEPEPGFPLMVHTCAQMGGGSNYSGYCNPQYEEMFRQQAGATDPVKRQQLVWAMQQKIFDDGPYIMTVLNKQVDAYRNDRFTGFGRFPGYILWKANLMQAKPVAASH